jgi:hypothetical protein
MRGSFAEKQEQRWLGEALDAGVDAPVPVVVPPAAVASSSHFAATCKKHM